MPALPIMLDALMLRPYAPADEAACLALFDSNTPDFFAPAERADFADYLRRADEAILCVVLPAGELVAVGGTYVRDGVGGLAWGMVGRAWHGQGIGRQLLAARLAALAAAGVATVSVRTSQHSRGFFERAGFVPGRVVPDGFAPGLDLIELHRVLGPAPAP